jgi:hypothetical protein
MAIATTTKAKNEKTIAMIVISHIFATLSSALPTDSSTRDASISALRNSIAALDKSISALEDSSPGWERWAIASSIGVFVGIIGEVIVIACEYLDELRDWKQGKIFWNWRIVLPPERPVRRRFWFDIFATFVVLAGIMGEFSASIKLSDINGQLRTKTSLLRDDTDQLIALVSQEAADANERARAEEKATQGLKTRADVAEAALARITGPAYAVRVDDATGIANPDLSKSTKQVLSLTRDTRLTFPTLPKGQSINWTLTVAQDSKGQHQITTFPFDISHGNVQQAPPFSSRVCSLTTDSNGTRRADIDCGYNDPPSTTKK